MQMTLRRYRLPLKHPFGLSRGRRSTVGSLIVELRQHGRWGYGEATENAYYGTTLEVLAEALEGVRRIVESTTLHDPVVFHRKVLDALADEAFARCALDEAAWDLYGKLAGRPAWKLWGLSLDAVPPSSFTIGLDSEEVMVAKLEESPDWPIYKIKLGRQGGGDVQIVRRLRRHSDAVFRVDANCGWTAAETIRNSQAMAELGVEFIEQPLPADAWREMEEVYARSALPLVADESCRRPQDLQRCQGRFHGVNIKLMKCGGLTTARRMLEEAKQLGLKTMIGCMTESSVGISAAAMLLPLVDYADLDGAELLAADAAHGVKVKQGHVLFPHESGTGVRLLGA